MVALSTGFQLGELDYEATQLQSSEPTVNEDATQDAFRLLWQNSIDVTQLSKLENETEINGSLNSYDLLNKVD